MTVAGGLSLVCGGSGLAFCMQAGGGQDETSRDLGGRKSRRLMRCLVRINFF